MTERVFDIFNQFATDPNAELDGVWVPIGPALRTKEDGSPDPESAPAIKVARSNNKRYSRMLVAEYEANKSVLDMKNDLADARNDEVMVDIGAKGLLLGWKNLTFKGKKLEDGWNIADAKMLLAVKDFRELVGRHAADRAHFLVVKEDAAAKN